METIIIILKVEAGKGRDYLVWALSPDMGRLVFVFKRSKDFYEPGLFRVMKVRLERQLNKTTLQLDENSLYKGEVIELSTTMISFLNHTKISIKLVNCPRLFSRSLVRIMHAL